MTDDRYSFDKIINIAGKDFDEFVSLNIDSFYFV
jgi:hypothetical protein